jgi:hypothetical protein
MPERAWEIRMTAQAERWYMTLEPGDAERVAASLDELERRGPSLGRPFVDSVKGSRHPNMKELRSVGGHLRALFAFDPARRALVLLGGDKANNWRGWYERAIPAADRLYDQHLRNLGGKEPWRTQRPGGRSADRGL